MTYDRRVKAFLFYILSSYAIPKSFFGTTKYSREVIYPTSSGKDGGGPRVMFLMTSGALGRFGVRRNVWISMSVETEPVLANR